MYYVLDYLTNPSVDEDDDDVPFLEIHEELVKVPGSVNWHMGTRFTDPMNAPIDVPVTPRFGYQGPPPDYFDGSISLMSRRLANVLRENGVDNLDLYQVSLVYRDTGKRDEHFAFNLIGVVSAVDLGKSNLESHDGDNLIDTSIRGFSVDLARTHDLAMFRLAENVMTVLVHERIRDAIAAAGINTFVFVKPESWIQM